MQYVLVSIVALLGSALTLFSGFGLGTLLLPVFGIFFPLEIAIALTAIVHFLNNIFKVLLLGRYADKRIILLFGIPSVLFAFLGAWLLTHLTGLPGLASYTLNGKVFEITLFKMLVGLLLILFALIDLVPGLSKIQFPQKWIPVGGALSGFFGGLSGHQGALRSAFLLRSGLSKEAFIATGVVIACMIDVSRLTVYSRSMSAHLEYMDFGMVIAGTMAAFSGAFFGKQLLKKVTLGFVQKIVGICIILFGMGLIAGLV